MDCRVMITRAGAMVVFVFILCVLFLGAGYAGEWSVDGSTIAVYHFDDLTDGSGHGFHVKAKGNATLTAENLGWMTNPRGQALKVSGLGDEVTVNIPDALVMPGATSSPLTLEAWIYPITYHAYGIGNYNILAFSQSWDCGLEVKDGKWNSPPAPTVKAGKTTVVSDDQWQQAASLNSWHLLRITHDQNLVQVSIDGEVVGSSTTAFNFGRTTDWVVTLGNFTGYLDELRISNVVRTGPPPEDPLENQPPQVDAGTDLGVVIGSFAYLAGNVTDDGLLNEIAAVSWTRVSGPNTVTFADASSARTSVDFSDPGIYVLRLTADDGEFSAFDDLMVTVREASDETRLPFSIVVLPDTQTYADYAPAKFNAQTQWIANSMDELNIKMVLHEGDIVNHASDSREWGNAKASMSLLDEVAPYVLSVGNHDYAGGRDSESFNNHFSTSDYQGLPTFGGVFEPGKLDNSYHHFSAGGLGFLVISLEFGPRDEVLQWAEGVISAHPGHRVVILTHAYLAGDSTRLSQGDDSNPHFYSLTGSVNDGEEIWQGLVRKYGNIDFVFSGHVRGADGTGCAHAYRTDTGDEGNTVHQIVANYQDCYGGGSGYLRIIRFDPKFRTASVSTYSPYLDHYLTDPANQFIISNLSLFAEENPVNRPPTVDAGPDRSVLLGEPVSVVGTVNDDGLLTTVPEVQWTKSRGEENVTFSDPYRPVTTASFDNAGTYTLELRAFDGEYWSQDTVMITVTAPNSPPDAHEQMIVLNEDESLEIILTATDLEADPVTFEVTRSPEHGTLSGTPPLLSYCPEPNYFGIDSYAFRVVDDKGGVDAATVAITINPVNDPPLADPLSFTITAGSALSFALQGSDVENDPLTFTVVSKPQHGALVRQGNAQVFYTPNIGFSGIDSFRYLTHDGQAESPVTTVIIEVSRASEEYQVDGATVAVYHFDDLTDGSGHGFHVTVKGNATLTAENLGWMTNPRGQALKVSGLGDEVTVNIPDALVMPGVTSSPLTLEAWIYPIAYHAYGIGNYNILAFSQSWDCGLEVKDGKWNSPPVPTVKAGKTTVVSDDQWQQAASLNSWHLLRITHDQNVVQVSIDGEVLGNNSTALNFGRTTDWVVTLGNFTGYVDELRISSVVR